MAQAGLDYAHSHFKFFSEDKTERRLCDIQTINPSFKFETKVIHGENRIEKHIKVPYRGQKLKKQTLLTQLKNWEKKGTIEPSVTRSIQYLIENSDTLDLSKHYIILFGAGSAM